MPGKVKVKIISGRNLPVMDRSSDTTDAYVEIKLGNTSFKTDVCRKSLNPLWNSEWYRFEVDDLELQDEPLQIRLMDHDTYSANDAIGKVYLNLNPLLTPAAGLTVKYSWSVDSNIKNQTSSSIMSGWIPVYDTMHGIRGEVNITVKVELFTDFNKFRQSSCGVQFFCSSTIPHGFYTQVIHGFVEELVVNDDPEYQWIDKIRTPRASNEARQTLFFKLSGELQRKIGVKTLDLGGNAVIGYNQCFDLEGESGIVARGIGTAVTLIKHHEMHQQLDEKIAEEYIIESPVQSRLQDNPPYLNNSRRGHHRTDSTGGKIFNSPARLNAVPCIHRRSSDSDLSITPKGNSLTGSDKSTNATNSSYQYNRPGLLHPAVDNFDMMEYPFLTLSKYPPGFILHLGSAISARSVKLLERITNIEEPESRDTWWSELRMEIRSHARALNCNAVLGYIESTSICDEICVLSASGTAAVINLCNGDHFCGITGLAVLNKLTISNKDLMTTSLDRTDFEQDKILNTKCNPSVDSVVIPNKIPQVTENLGQELVGEYPVPNTCHSPCSLCHIPYNESNVSFRMTMLNCAMCKIAKVPDVLLTTVEIPDSVPSTGRGCFLQSYVCRPKRDLKGELNAKEISESLPFLEYELHRLLINKMKVKGMNAIFGLKVRITIGEKLLIGIATGSAVYLLPLPTPTLPKLVAGNATTDSEKILDMQKLLFETMKKNIEIYDLKTHLEPELTPNFILSNTFDAEEKKTSLDLNNKDCCILEVDDSEDIEVINLLMEPRPPEGFQVVNTEIVPGMDDIELAKNLQMFTQVWRARIPLNQPASHFDKHFQKLLQSVYFKLRRMIPCALCDLEFRIDLPETDEIQLTLLGMALALGDPSKVSKFKRKNTCQFTTKEHKKIDDDLIFTLEEDQVRENSIPITSQSGLLSTQFIKYRQKSPTRVKVNSKQRLMPIRERHGVDITPLSYIPGGRIEKYLGYLNFFFIRETNSIREGGGLSGFVHSFITEVLAIVRAHVIALGGNAMVAYFMTECVLYHSTHKNQGQCLINVGGDVVFVSYFMED